MHCSKAGKSIFNLGNNKSSPPPPPLPPHAPVSVVVTNNPFSKPPVENKPIYNPTTEQKVQ